MEVDTEKLPAAVAVFPLPNIVLFPHTRLPLHIFEPRYLEMVNDALSGSRHIAMSLLKQGWEAQSQGHPAFHPIGCLGRIVAWEELAEDRCNIVLFGVQKVEFGIPAQDRAYQQAPVRFIQDHVPESPEAALRLRRTLTETARTLLMIQGQKAEQVDQMLSTTEAMPLETVTNWACVLLNIEPATKQSLLELTEVAVRCDQVTRIMVSRIESFSKSAPSSPPVTAPSTLN